MFTQGEQKFPFGNGEDLWPAPAENKDSEDFLIVLQWYGEGNIQLGRVQFAPKGARGSFGQLSLKRFPLQGRIQSGVRAFQDLIRSWVTYFCARPRNQQIKLRFTFI